MHMLQVTKVPCFKRWINHCAYGIRAHGIKLIIKSQIT